MENVVRAMARFDAIRASAPRPSPAPGFEAHLAAVTMATPTHTHAAPPSPAAAGVTLGQFVGVEAPAGLAVLSPATPGGWVRPVDAEVGSEFGVRLHPILDVVRMRKGIDMGVPTGAPIRAVAPGVVAFAEERSGYGNVVHVDFEVRRDCEAVDSEPYLAGM